MPQSRIRRYMRHGTLPQLAVFEASARHACFTRAARSFISRSPPCPRRFASCPRRSAPRSSRRSAAACASPRRARTYATAASSFALLGRLDDALCELREVEGSELRVAVADAASRLAARLLAAFAQEHETVAIRVRVANRAALLAQHVAA
jgi:DNA-binding transcriptional LysR family regulator